jgi:uncharacterized iron-regulated protein
MNISSSLMIIIMFLMGSYINAHAAPQFLRVSDKRTVESMQMIADTYGTDLIFIGETHDVMKQHENQLDIIRAISAKKVPVAIGLEIFASDSQRQLDDWIAGKLDEQDFKLIYSKNWSYDWLLYRDIFIFARDNHIPMVALNIPKPIISKIVVQGSSVLNDNDKKEIPPHISWTLNTPQTEYLKRIYLQVFGNKSVPISFTNFCEAQALRNNGMAWNISKYREKYPKNKIVVLAGTWHAIKNGIPEQLRLYGNPRYKVILPELPEFNLQNVTSDEADYFILN